MLLLTLLLAAPALAQPADCRMVPVGPPIDVQAYVNPPGRPAIIAGVTLPPTPMFGTRCIAAAVPPADVLHGPPAPNGLLQGDGPRDVLHDRPTPQILVGPPP